MRIARSALVFPAACLVALLMLGACSDSDKDDKAAATSTTSAAAAVTSTTAKVVRNFTGEGSAELCQFLYTFIASQQSVTGSAAGTPAALETAFKQSLASLQQAEAIASDEVRPDIAKISDTFEAFDAAAAKVGYVALNIPLADLNALQEKPFTDAVAAVTQYRTTYC